MHSVGVAGLSLTWRFLETRYEISVSNPERRSRGVREATLDGALVDHLAIPLVNDGQVHEVRIVLATGSVANHAPAEKRQSASPGAGGLRP